MEIVIFWVVIFRVIKSSWRDKRLPSTTMLVIQWHGTHFINSFWAHDALRWRHNERDSVSNHQPHGCFLNRLFGRRSKKTSKLRVTGLCAGKSPGPVNSPHKGPVTRKMFPFDDVIMCENNLATISTVMILAIEATRFGSHDYNLFVKWV